MNVFMKILRMIKVKRDHIVVIPRPVIIEGEEYYLGWDEDGVPSVFEKVGGNKIDIDLTKIEGSCGAYGAFEALKQIL